MKNRMLAGKFGSLTAIFAMVISTMYSTNAFSDCPDLVVNCWNKKAGSKEGPAIKVGMCWKWEKVKCEPCDGKAVDNIKADCQKKYGTDLVIEHLSL